LILLLLLLFTKERQSATFHCREGLLTVVLESVKRWYTYKATRAENN